jgi:ubiquinone/menaquinone biosynthesis C-methylase UbiE
MAGVKGSSWFKARPVMVERSHSSSHGSLFAPTRHFDPDHLEQIDQPGLDRALLRKELQTLENCNRRSHGHELTLWYVERFVASTGATSLSILDLGTGAADTPRAIVAWARQHQLPVTITAVDKNAEILQIAREWCRDWPEIRFEQQDLRSLSYEADSFDLALCSLALHHFEAMEAIGILRSMQRLARGGYVVSDLCRSWPAILSTVVMFPILFRSPVFRDDAAQSCRAAFTVQELREMAQQAGLNNFQIKHHHAMIRMVLEGRK